MQSKLMERTWETLIDPMEVLIFKYKSEELKCLLGSQIDHTTKEASNDCGGKDLR